MKNSILVLIFATIGLILFSLLTSPLLTSPTNSVAQSKDLIHVVKKGESLTEIAKIYYGSPDYWTNLWNENTKIINPSIIEPGLEIVVQKSKPTHIEDVDEKLMKRLLSYPANKPIDANLAYAQAAPTHNFISPAVTLNTPTTVPVVKVTIGGFDDVYRQAGEKYGVPWQILYGLHLTETGLRDGAIYNGHGSGAQGPMQFMPGTWRAYGVDGNGDGVADINNAIDAIHGAANYLVEHGGVEQGLRYYGGNTSGTLAAACSMGYCL